MNAESFELDHHLLATELPSAGLVQEISARRTIDSQETFNAFCKKSCDVWFKHLPNGSGTTTRLFIDLLERIHRADEDVIRTSWGGVVVTKHEHPWVEKWLVVKRGGYLPLEKHKQKDERIEVKEGAGIMLSRQKPTDPLKVELLRPDKRFHFKPGMEHCIIGTEDLLLFERSTDPKGMDQDLIFVFSPE